MSNSGVVPVSTTSAVGKVRLTIGDTAYVALVPAVTGFGDFTLFSDDEITAFLTSSGDSVLGAAGYAFLSLSASATLSSKSVKDFDLAVDTTKRAGEYRALASLYFEQAGIVGGGEYFDIVATGSYPTADEFAEATYPYDTGFDFSWRV